MIYDEKACHSERFCFIISVLPIPCLSINKGNDRGRQYRTGIYYQDEADLPAIYTVVQDQERMLGRKIAVEVGATTPLHSGRRLSPRLILGRILQVTVISM